MTEAETAAPVSTENDLLERLRRENEELRAGKALAEGQRDLLEQGHRARIAGYAPDAQFLFKEFAVAEANGDAEALAEMDPIMKWPDEFGQKKDIMAQAALARASMLCSKGIKRMRDENSQLPDLQKKYAESLKKNEELEEALAKKTREYDGAMQLNEERQRGLEAMDKEIVRLGGVQQKFDFSKLSSREAAPPAEPHTMAAAATPALEAVKAEASKAATKPSGNPLESHGDDLLTRMLNQSSAGGRFMATGSSHAILGTASGEPDLATIVRGM